MNNKTALLIAALFLSAVTGMVWHIKTLQTTIIEETGLLNAKLIATAVVESHRIYFSELTSYARQVESEKIQDHTKSDAVALAETLSLTLGKRIGEKVLGDAQVQLYSQSSFSSHKDSPNRNDDFKNRAWKQLSMSPGQAFYEFQQKDHRTLIHYAMANALESGELGGIIEVSLPLNYVVPKDNNILRTTVLVYSGIAVSGLVIIILIILKQKHFTDELNRLTTTDPLTGLYNQSELFTSLMRETDKVKRGGSSLCLIYFNIDGFKQINDTVGRLKGDELLRFIGEMLPQLIRTFDIPCRYSGEEFAIILPGCTTNAAVQIGERIIANFHKKYPQVHLSMGISQCDMNNYLDSAQLLNQAIINKNAAI